MSEEELSNKFEKTVHTANYISEQSQAVRSFVDQQILDKRSAANELDRLEQVLVSTLVELMEIVERLKEYSERDADLIELTRGVMFSLSAEIEMCRSAKATYNNLANL